VYAANDDETSQFATTVAPNLSAQYHQHMFSVRVDPMIDGLNNSVVESDIIPLPDAPTGSAMNFAGNAFISQDTILKTESARSYDYQKERRWKIINPSRKHYSSGKEVGYTVGMKGGATPMVTRPDGWAARRAAFLTEAVWVCRDEEGEKGGRMWPSGKYVPQTRDEPEDSVGKWVRGKGNVDNEDILLFLTVGKNFGFLLHEPL
jgi:primary-amine oxidase